MTMNVAPDSALTFINANIGMGKPTSLRVFESRIWAVGEVPHAGDVVVDLQGDRLLPGLINAHDHLQLNSLPDLECKIRYRHVREWISDINARRRSDQAFEARVAVTREDRLLIGGLKNLLSGVTTVAHHDPMYTFVSSQNFPTRIVTDYGWSHSLYIDGEQKVLDSYRGTPFEWPWIIHAAEGLDEDAAHEFTRLEALGILRPNTIIVHGVALDREQRERLVHAGAGLIWCPSSNLRLFGKSADVTDLIQHGRVALGTDSRLSGARDLLEELGIAREVGGLDEATLQSLVTETSAKLLRLRDRGTLKPGAAADLMILPARVALGEATRADVRLVLVQGVARYGDRDYAEILNSPAHWAEVRVDGKEKMLDSSIAAAVMAATAAEVGLELSDVAWRAA